MLDYLTNPIFITLLLGTLLGFLSYVIFINHLLPKMESKEALRQRNSMLKEANIQKKSILERQRTIKEENLNILKEELNEDIAQKRKELESKQEEIEAQKSLQELRNEEAIKKEKSISSYKQVIETIDQNTKQVRSRLEESSQKITEHLSKACEVNTKTALEQRIANIVSRAQIDIQKRKKLEIEDLSSQLTKKAQQKLSRVISRYSPNFYWPKPVNLVEITHSTHLNRLHSSKDTLLEELKELSGVDINLVDEKEDKEAKAIKVIGGFGIAKEASRLTLEKILAEPDFSAWKKSKGLFNQHFQQLSKEAEQLGARAVKKLNLKNIHPEIQKLVGALNWRTSYRQNQWHHTVEVATLAGILAHELGENPDAAKRTGLLHDIGKALDYGIDASHAIISADYADRYGEERYICDVVMSHHADLLVESPLAYALQTADTLSGARPGARVNLEEGYQIRLGAIQDAVYSFKGISDLAIMNGGREVHVQVFHNQVSPKNLPTLAKEIAKQIEEDVSYPGQIKVIVTRTLEATKVA